jgi:hypothetical protein
MRYVKNDAAVDLRDCCTAWYVEPFRQDHHGAFRSVPQTSKSAMREHTQVPEPLIPLLCGGFGEFCASIVFVPCEVFNSARVIVVIT